MFFACALNAAVIERGPYIEDLKFTSATLRWSTSVPAASWVEYGPEGRCSQIMAISPRKRSHSVTLQGLIPNTKFCYKVYVQNNAGNGVQAPAEGHFRTLLTPERKTLSFLVVGNTSASSKGGTLAIKQKMARTMEEYPADFIIHTGNIAANGLDSGETYDFFKPYKFLLRSTPIFMTLGEDEYGPMGKNGEGKSFLDDNFKKANAMPWGQGAPNYYYIDSAHARIIFLDTNNMYGISAAPGLSRESAQYQWLKKTLATAGGGRWKIVVMHHPVYSSGASEDRLSRLLGPLFDSEKVNLVIQGHQGAYERTTPISGGAEAKAGPVYMTVGGSGKFFEHASYGNKWSAKYFDVPHFAQVQITDRKLALRAYDADGKKIDALDIYF